MLDQNPTNWLRSTPLQVAALALVTMLWSCGPDVSDSEPFGVVPQFTGTESCPPCDLPTNDQKDDFASAYDYIQLNEGDCVGTTANYATAGWQSFNTRVGQAKVGIDGGTSDWGWWDSAEPGGYRIGMTSDFWDSNGDIQYWEDLAATILHEGLHDYLGQGSTAHSIIELVESECILW